MTYPKHATLDNPADVLVIYHDNCPDGFGAAFSAWTVYGDAATYIPYNHGDTPVDVSGKHVVMVDCCYHKHDACKAHANASSFIVLDHHHTAQVECGELDFCHFDMKRSGMGMAWDYFHPEKVRPALVRHVEARDLWKWGDADSRPFCLKLDTIPRTFENWAHIAAMTDLELSEFLKDGRAMLEQSDAMIEKFCEDARKVTFMGYKVWLLNVPRPFATDDCGSRLAAREETDFALLWNSPDLSEVRLSFRSANGFDVSSVAKKLGGGGHKAASGAKLDFFDFKEMVKF